MPGRRSPDRRQIAWCIGVTSGTNPKPASGASGVTSVTPGQRASRRNAPASGTPTREISLTRPRSTAKACPHPNSSQPTRAPQACTAAAYTADC